MNNDLGLGINETPLRGYDAQIGRFGGIDLFSEINDDNSPYVFGGNNPIYFNDPTGLLEHGPDDELWDFKNNKPKEALVLDEVVIHSTPKTEMSYFLDFSFGFDDYYPDFFRFNQTSGSSGGTGYGSGGKGNATNNIHTEDLKEVSVKATIHKNSSGNIIDAVSTAFSIAADNHNTMVSLTKVMAKETGTALKMISRTGTVIGAVAGGVPAIYKIYNGNGENEDYIAAGLAIGGIALEWFGVGEAWDVVGLVWNVGSLGYDVYNAAKKK